VERRRLLAGLSIGLAAVLTGCGRGRTSAAPLGHPVPNLPTHPSGSPSTSPSTSPPTSSPTSVPPAVGPDGGPTLLAVDPSSLEVLWHAPSKTSDIALTIDDGYDHETVAAYVEFAQRTGIHLTFSPNGIYAETWSVHATTLQPLIATGQIQIGNHTYAHKDLTKLSATQIRTEVERNEDWIGATFGTTSRPYLRPPFGFYNHAVIEACAQAGFPKILMWDGTFGDSALLTQEQLLEQARKYLLPGTVMLGHANHPTVTHVYDQIVELLHSRDLNAVTLDEMFGSHRQGTAEL
jgi:peptidoglycan/xylan/chitin deacetylase (PgdA/CDA1 family)